MAPQTDQTQGKPGESKEPRGIEAGWGRAEKFLEQTKLAEEAKAKPAPAATEECPDCPKDKTKQAQPKPEDRKPFRTYKVQGKEVHVYSQEEADALAMKGLDYTKKTQSVAEERRQLAEDRKKAEEEIGSKSAEIGEVTKKLESIIERLDGKQKGTTMKAVGGEQPEATVTKPTVTLESVYTEYEIDPKFAEPWQKKMVENDFRARKENEELKARLTEVDTQQRVMVGKEAVNLMGQLIVKAREEFPIEEYYDEKSGVNITKEEIFARIRSKVQRAIDSGQQAEAKISDIIVETVREISESQKQAANKAAPPVSDDSTDEEVEAWLAKTFPKRFPAIKAKVSENAVAEHEEEKTIIPPSLSGRSGEAEDGARTTPRKPKGRGTAAWIDKAVESDPEIAALFQR